MIVHDFQDERAGLVGELARVIDRWPQPFEEENQQRIAVSVRDPDLLSGLIIQRLIIAYTAPHGFVFEGFCSHGTGQGKGVFIGRVGFQPVIVHPQAGLRRLE